MIDDPQENIPPTGELEGLCLKLRDRLNDLTGGQAQDTKMCSVIILAREGGPGMGLSMQGPHGMTMRMLKGAMVMLLEQFQADFEREHPAPSETPTPEENERS